jgi:hypothetical protein
MKTKKCQKERSAEIPDCRESPESDFGAVYDAIRSVNSPLPSLERSPFMGYRFF